MESIFEQRVTKRLENKGWYNVKLSKTNRNGIPDRMYLRDGQMFFVEYKSVKGKLSELQKYRIDQLRHKGFHVFILKEKR